MQSFKQQQNMIRGIAAVQQYVTWAKPKSRFRQGAA
jgi:hypothetical protein